MAAQSLGHLIENDESESAINLFSIEFSELVHLHLIPEAPSAEGAKPSPRVNIIITRWHVVDSVESADL